MYHCGFCKQLTGPKVPRRLVVVEQRSKTYPPRHKIGKIKRGGETIDRSDPGGSGWEIVREIAACPPCATENSEA